MKGDMATQLPAEQVIPYVTPAGNAEPLRAVTLERFEAFIDPSSAA